MINKVAAQSIIHLRGGGCGSGKVAVLEPTQQVFNPIQQYLDPNQQVLDPIQQETQYIGLLPSSLLSITQIKVKSLQSKMLTIADKSVQDEYLNTINWLDINEYWYQRIPDDKTNMTKCIKLLQSLLMEILEIVESIIDGSRFIAYSLLRVANNFSRIMVVYYTQNEGTVLDLKLSNCLKERISNIKEMIKKFGETALYYNGLQYESGIIEACINICPVDDPQGKELGFKALKEIVKSAASFSPSEDLFSSLGDLLFFGVKSLYQKYKESNFKEMMTKCLFIEQFKWTIVTSIEKQKFSITSIFNTLAKFYKNEVLSSKSWEVKYCWIKANHWIMGYKIIITKDMLNHQQIDKFDQFWYHLSSEQVIQIIDRSDHAIGAIINEELAQTMDLGASNPIYSRLMTYIHSINRIKSKLLCGSEKLPKLLDYDKEFSNSNHSNEVNQKVIEIQTQLQQFDLSNILEQFAQMENLIKNLLVQFSDLNDQLTLYNHTVPDQDNIYDICQSSRLIGKQLQALKEQMIGLRTTLIQFGYVADNFIDVLFIDTKFKEDHSIQDQIIQTQIIINQIYLLLVDYQNYDIKDNNHKDQYQSSIITYFNNLQIAQLEKYKLISEIKETIKHNYDITKQIKEIEELNSSLLNKCSGKSIDLIRLISYIIQSRLGINVLQLWKDRQYESR